jgi:hypothetical protein
MIGGVCNKNLTEIKSVSALAELYSQAGGKATQHKHKGRILTKIEECMAIA